MKEDEESETQIQAEPFPVSRESDQRPGTLPSQNIQSNSINTFPTTPNYINPTTNLQFPPPHQSQPPLFTLSNFPPISNSTTSTPNRRPSHLSRTNSSHNLHPSSFPTSARPPFLPPVPNHIENFLSNLILLLIDLLSSYLPSASILFKLQNLTSVLSSKSAT